MTTVLHISNRLNDPRDPDAKAGGLDNTLKSVPAGIDHVARLGWSGQTVPDREYNFSDIRQHLEVFDYTDSYGQTMTYALLDLPESLQADFYEVVANGDLWSNFHFRPDLANVNSGQDIDLESARANYFKVNELFARAIREVVEPHWTIVTHDYHLLPLAEELRKLEINNPNGIMMHTPLPSEEVLSDGRLDSGTRNFIHGLLADKLFAFDMVGLQAPWDLENLQTITKGGYHTSLEPYQTDTIYNPRGHSILAGVFPATGDTDINRQKAEEYISNPLTARFMRNALSGGRAVDIVGMDRLDYSKALPKRLEAVRLCIEAHGMDPHGIHLIQPAPFGRERVYGYKEELAAYTSRYEALRKDYGNVVYTPFKDDGKPGAVDQGIMFAAYRESKVGIFTSDRDGQHLGPTEYTACQLAEDPGVLLMTHTIGAAHLFKDAGIVVDPNAQAIAEGIIRAKATPLEQRQEFHQKALEVITENTNARWVTALVESTQQGADQRQSIDLSNVIGFES